MYNDTTNMPLSGNVNLSLKECAMIKEYQHQHSAKQ